MDSRSLSLPLVTILATLMIALPATPRRATVTEPEPVPTRQWPTPFSVDLRDMPPSTQLAPGTTRILVLGDSVAQFLGLALRYRQDERSAFVAARGIGQCSIFEAKTRVDDGKLVEGTSCSATWARDVAELRPDVTLIVQGGAFLNPLACDAAWLSAYEQRIVTLLRVMGSDAGKVVLARVPYPMGRWRAAAGASTMRHVDCFNRMIDQTSLDTGASALDLMTHICPTPDCIAESRPDGLHFDGVGAEETAR